MYSNRARGSAKFDVLAIFSTFVRWPLSWRLAAAVTTVLLGVALRSVFLGALEGTLIYVTLLPAVAVAAVVSGVSGGILATILSALAALALMPPLPIHAVVPGLAAFFCGGAVLTGIAKVLRMALQRYAADDQRDSERLLKAVFETSMEGMLVIDKRAIVRAANPAVEELFGYETNEMLGRSIGTLMPELAGVAPDSYVARYPGEGVKTLIGFGRKVVGLRKNGEIFQHELTIADVAVHRDGSFIGFVRDLTQIENERRKTEAARAELLHVARLSDMSEAAAGLAHEVSQPLTAILTYASAARRALAPTTEPSLARVIEVIETQAKNAADILNRLRGFIEKRESQRQPENLAQLIEDALALASVRANGRHVRILWQPSPEPFVVNVDRVEIIQVLVNFLRNASDAMADHPDPEVVIETRMEKPGIVRVDVSDNGPGVDSRVVDHLFTPFVTTKSFGVGVGLSLCKTIIESHNGKIGYAANTPKGALFWFTLPIVESSETADDPVSAGRGPVV